MQLKYYPTEKAFIIGHLFMIRHVPRLWKQMRAMVFIARGLFSVLLVLQLMPLFVIRENITFLKIIGCIFLLCLIILYPLFNNWLYKYTYKRKFKGLVLAGENKEISLNINNEEVQVSDARGEYKMKTADIVSFFEIKQLFIIQLHFEVFLWIDKDQYFDREKEIETELKGCASKYNIPYIEKLQWSEYMYSRKNK